MRRDIWGWANPKTQYIEWLNATYHNVVYADNTKQKINIINMPLFKCTITMEQVLNSFVGGIQFVDRPISGYKNCDEIIADMESIHKAYTGYDKSGYGAIWAHPKQRH